MSWYLPTVCLILSFKQNIMTFRLGCYLMHQLKGISQLLNIVYVKHTEKEKKYQPIPELPLYKVPWCVPLLKITCTENDFSLKTDRRRYILYPLHGADLSLACERGLWDICIMERAYEILENKKSCSKITYSRINLVMGCYWWDEKVILVVDL